MRITIDLAQAARTFEQFKDNAAMQESAQLFAQGRPVAEMLQALAMNPAVMSTFAGFAAIYPHGKLERGLLEKVILRVSRLNACQFCVDSHIDVARSLGIRFSEDVDAQAPEHSAREQLAIEYAGELHRDSHGVSDELFARLRAQFSEPEIVELTFLVGFINLLNWFNNALGVAYRGEFRGLPVR